MFLRAHQGRTCSEWRQAWGNAEEEGETINPDFKKEVSSFEKAKKYHWLLGERELKKIWLFLCYKETSAASFQSPKALDSVLSSLRVNGDPRGGLAFLLWPGDDSAFLRTAMLTFFTADIIQVQYSPGLKKEPPERAKNNGFTIADKGEFAESQ